MNRNQIIGFISDEFNVQGEQLWLNFPDYLVFRNERNKKWFAVLMDVERSRLGLAGEGRVDIVNLKCDPILTGSLRGARGYLPAYHMNKNSWISVLLDGTARDEEIADLLRLSFETIDAKK